MNDTRARLEAIKDLPTLPDVVAKVNRLVNSEHASASDINAVIRRDLALSGKVLRLVNSSFYGFPRRINSITRAVVILGFRTVRNLTLSAFVFSTFRKGMQGFDARAFWTHSIGVAVTSAAAAEELGFSTRGREDAFIAGLLHGVGKVVLCEYAPEQMHEVLHRRDVEDMSLLEAEQAVLGYTHADLGGAVLENWNLPEAIVQVVRHYPDPTKAGQDLRPCALVHASEILTRAMLFGNPGEERMPLVSARAWDEIELNHKILGRIMDRALDEMHRADAFLELL